METREGSGRTGERREQRREARAWVGGKRKKSGMRESVMERARALDSDNWLGHSVTLGKLLKHSGSIIVLFSKMYVCVVSGT